MPELQVTVQEQVDALKQVLQQLQGENSNLRAMNVILSGRLEAAETKVTALETAPVNSHKAEAVENAAPLG